MQDGIPPMATIASIADISYGHNCLSITICSHTPQKLIIRYQMDTIANTDDISYEHSLVYKALNEIIEISLMNATIYRSDAK